MRKKFWKNKKIFITGHTGFKGSWMSLILKELGAKVVGYSLKPSKKNNLFLDVDLKNRIYKSYIGDILDKEKLKKILIKNKPDIIIHMAAQPLVKKSYIDPVNTFQTNILGTVNLLDIATKMKCTKLLLVTTSDKVYDIRNKKIFKENDPLRGLDPYSASKVCQENIILSYFFSFFQNKKTILTTRSGNILGGGDFSDDRIIPDYANAYKKNKKIYIRNPNSTRPWQHILDASDAYLKLIEKFYNKPNTMKEVSWNISSINRNNMSVLQLVKSFNSLSDKKIKIKFAKKKYLETKSLNINSIKIKETLGWVNKLNIKQSIKLTLFWYLKYFENKKNSYKITLDQIKNYLYSN